MVRKLQPDILINGRAKLREDFDTPECVIRASKKGRAWETCMTMNSHWGYCADDNNWKSTRELVRQLTYVIGYGGNYLLNIGPKADGSVPKASVTRLLEMGKWLKVNGEAVYRTESGPIGNGGAGDVGVNTAKGKNIYVVIQWWPGREFCLPIGNIGVKSAYLLATKQNLHLEQTKSRLMIRNLPARNPDPLGSVIVLKR